MLVLPVTTKILAGSINSLETRRSNKRPTWLAASVSVEESKNSTGWPSGDAGAASAPPNWRNNRAIICVLRQFIDKSTRTTPGPGLSRIKPWSNTSCCGSANFIKRVDPSSLNKPSSVSNQRGAKSCASSIIMVSKRVVDSVKCSAMWSNGACDHHSLASSLDMFSGTDNLGKSSRSSNVFCTGPTVNNSFSGEASRKVAAIGSLKHVNKVRSLRAKARSTQVRAKRVLPLPAVPETTTRSFISKVAKARVCPSVMRRKVVRATLAWAWGSQRKS